MTRTEPAGSGDNRREHVHAERRPQEEVLASDLVGRREGRARHVGEHGVAPEPIPIREDEMRLAAEHDQDKRGTETGGEPKLVERLRQEATVASRVGRAEEDVARRADEHHRRRPCRQVNSEENVRQQQEK